MTRRGAVNLNLVLAVVLVGLLLLFLRERQAAIRAERRAVTAEEAADSLRRRGDSVAVVYQVDTLRLTRWMTRWDSVTLPGVVDTVPVEVLVAVADSTIRACTVALSTCELRVATERERGDSLAVAAASWRKVARGKWVTPRLELTVTPRLDPQAAAEVSVGRGRLRVLGRAEVGDEATVRLGVSWAP